MTVDQGPCAGDAYGRITCKEDKARLHSPVSSFLITHENLQVIPKRFAAPAVMLLMLLKEDRFEPQKPAPGLAAGVHRP